MSCVITSDNKATFWLLLTYILTICRVVYFFCALKWFIYFEAVVKFGLWLAPGDSEEVATALSRALRNFIKRLGGYILTNFLNPNYQI